MKTEEEKRKAKNTAAMKCLDKNYKQYKINVKNELFAEWEQYAASKGLSMRALVIEAMQKAMEADGFTPEPTETTEE